MVSIFCLASTTKYRYVFDFSGITSLSLFSQFRSARVKHKASVLVGVLLLWSTMSLLKNIFDPLRRRLQFSLVISFEFWEKNRSNSLTSKSYTCWTIAVGRYAQTITYWTMNCGSINLFNTFAFVMVETFFGNSPIFNGKNQHFSFSLAMCFYIITINLCKCIRVWN